MKVYIVTSGTYSDYHIEAVFSTEEKAKAYIDKYGDYDDRRIEEYETDIESTEHENAIYIVHIRPKSTKVMRDYPLNCYHRPVDSIGILEIGGRAVGFSITVETDGAERAKKIASERLMQVKALPYLFPRLNEKCVGKKMRYYPNEWRTDWHYPIYNFHTKEIILEEGEFLKDETV